MKNYLKNSIGALAILAGSITANAQETVIKFFGQPEFGSRTETKKGGYFANPANTPELESVGVHLPDVWKDSTYSKSTKSAFSPGNFVLFVTSQLTERISVLSENTINAQVGVNSFTVQRLMARYYVKDYFSVRVGKMFNPLGYWNNQYNFGLVLQPTIQRPSIIRAPQEGGILQISNVGVQVEGDNISKMKLFYRLFLSNGNTSTSITDNLHNQYALTGALGFEPIEGLKVLGSAQLNTFSAGKPNLSNVTNVKGGKTILSNISIAYMNPEKKLEAMAEYYYQSSKFDSLGETHSYGVLGYLGFKLTNNLVPYVSDEYLVAGSKHSTDIYYVSPALPGINQTVNTFTVGLRYKFSPNFIVKGEYYISNNNVIYRDEQFPLNNQLYSATTVAPAPGYSFPDYPYTKGDKIASTITQGPRVQIAFSF